MSASLRWGLLGTAHITRQLIPAMREVRRSTVVAVASRDATRAREYAATWGVPTAHAGYDALLRDRAVDAVYIPLPNALHVEWTLRALDAGKHVLCEKPLAASADDVDRIEAVARDRRRVVEEGFMYRHEPLVGRVLALVNGGAIGELRSIDVGFSFLQARRPDVRLDAALGGGSLWDIGCYGVNAARLVAGAEPTAAVGLAVRGPSGVDVSFTGLLQFAGGIIATIESSFRAPYRNWIELRGTEGVLRTERIFRPGAVETIVVTRGEAVEQVTVEGSAMLFVRQIEDFVAAALDGRAPVVPLADSRGTAAALAALDASARTGRVVSI